MRLELLSVGVAIITALPTSTIPTAAAIVLLSLLEVWTHLETHWLHTWLFVACVVYILARGSGKRRIAMQTTARKARNTANGSCLVRIIDV
jgi:hypothetical protein